MFAHIDPSFSQTFTHYIIEKHDVLNMKTSKDEEEENMNQKRLSVSER